MKILLLIYLVFEFCFQYTSGQIFSTTNTAPTVCRTLSDCPSGCCKQTILSENYNVYGYLYSGTCSKNAPDDTEPCSENCPCKNGLVCTENFLCRKCSKICMNSEVYNK